MRQRSGVRRHLLKAVPIAAIAAAVLWFATVRPDALPLIEPTTARTHAPPPPRDESPSRAPRGDFPSRATTGVPAGTVLEPSDGITVTEDGTVIDRLDVSGRIAIRANNVTIKRSRISGGVPYQVRVYDGFTGTVVEDSELIGTSNGCSAGISMSDYTARRVDVHGCKDGLKVGSNVTIVDSWIHDQRKFEGTHNDGIQCVGGRNIVIRGNRIEGPFRQSTSATLFQTNIGPVDNVLVENNYLSGGGFTVYLTDKGNGNGAPTNAVVKNNTFERNSYQYGPFRTDGNPQISGNVWDNGKPMS